MIAAGFNREHCIAGLDALEFHPGGLFSRLARFRDQAGILSWHEFLSADRAVQRSRFSGGAVAVVNFSDAPRPYETGEGKVMLAPRGFWVKAPGFQQSRLVEAGEVVTRLEAKDYYSYACPQRRRIGTVELQGRLTIFRISDGVWHILAETQGDCLADLAQLPSFETSSKIGLFKVGATLRNEGASLEALIGNTLTIPSGVGMRLFRLQPKDQQGAVMARRSSGN